MLSSSGDLCPEKDDQTVSQKYLRVKWWHSTPDEVTEERLNIGYTW